VVTVCALKDSVNKKVKAVINSRKKCIPVRRATTRHGGRDGGTVFTVWIFRAAKVVYIVAVVNSSFGHFYVVLL